jgi:DNA-binding response OmpR family regulator
MTSSILLLDYDEYFRGALSHILRRAGYDVIESSSATYAADTLSSIDLALLVVNFELPDLNGIAFISCLREAGINAPVVFLSERAWDQQTFVQLRSILRVSLLLQKPIDPRDLYEQMKSLLPKISAPAGDIAGAVASAAQHSPKQTTGLSPGAHTPNNPIGEIFGLWMKLTQVLKIYESDMHQMHLGQEAFILTREIRGHGSELDSLQLTGVVTKIQGYVRLLDPHDAAGSSPVFTELSRLLGLGEVELQNALKRHQESGSRASRAVAGQRSEFEPAQGAPGVQENAFVPQRQPVDVPKIAVPRIVIPVVPDAVPNQQSNLVEQPMGLPSRVNVGAVLLLGNHETLKPGEGQGSPTVDAQITFVLSPEDALSAVSNKHFDMAAVDVSVATVRGSIDLARDLRKSGLNDTLPLTFFCPPDYKIDDADRLFAGCSVIVPAPCSQQKFEASVISLSSLNKAESASKKSAPDESTGLLTERDFLIRANTALINCGRSSQEMVIAFLRLSQSDSASRFAHPDPLIAPAIAKQLRCRFPFETLRGLWADGFGLVFCSEDSRYVEQALGKWAQEMARITAAASDGSRIPLYMDWKIARYPADGFSLEALIPIARSRADRK